MNSTDLFSCTFITLLPLFFYLIIQDLLVLPFSVSGMGVCYVHVNVFIGVID